MYGFFSAHYSLLQYNSFGVSVYGASVELVIDKLTSSQF